MTKTFKDIEKALLLTLVFLFPVVFFGGFPTPYSLPKIIFAIVFASLVILSCIIRSVVDKKATFNVGRFDFAIFLFALVYTVGAIIQTPNKMEAFLYPGGVTFVLIAATIYFLVNQYSKRFKNSVLTALFASGILLTIFSLFAQLGLLAKIPQLPAAIKDTAFNPMGSALQYAIYLLAVLPIGIYEVIKEKDITKKIFYGVASGLLAFGIIIVGINMLPGKPQAPAMPSWQTSWSIYVDTIKDSPVLGAGPGNYLSAFSIYKPLSYNQTDLWNFRFSSANDFYMTMITELGFAGVAVLAILLVSIFKAFKADLLKKNLQVFPVAVLVILFALFPTSPVNLVLLFTLLAAFSDSQEKTIELASGKVPAMIIGAPVVVGLVLLYIFGGRAVYAEVTFQKALSFAVANDGQNTYNYMVKAITLNKYVDRYHASLAQIEMALANSIATKEDITDADRSTITQLIQQAISEGKSTVALNPGRSGNWVVLAQIYRGIMSFAQGADQFAVQTFTQAVALDPTNPDLRISIGGVYYALGDFDNAINAFQLAIVAKNDSANAHYNLSAAYAGKRDYDNAISEMQYVLSLVPQDSNDYQVAKDALDQLNKNRPATTTETTSENLTPPTNLETTNVEPPITLPQEATPPASQ